MLSYTEFLTRTSRSDTHPDDAIMNRWAYAEYKQEHLACQNYLYELKKKPKKGYFSC